MTLNASTWLNSSVESAYIYGDMILSPKLIRNFTGTAYTWLKGIDSSYYISINDASINFNKLIFDSSKSSWLNTDNFFLQIQL